MQGDANVRVIFGMKRQCREPLGYSLKTLAQALNLSYDDLVSLKLENELNPLTSWLDSPLIQERAAGADCRGAALSLSG